MPIVLEKQEAPEFVLRECRNVLGRENCSVFADYCSLRVPNLSANTIIVVGPTCQACEVVQQGDYGASSSVMMWLSPESLLYSSGRPPQQCAELLGQATAAELRNRVKPDVLRHNEFMVKSVEGVYRNGKVELLEPLAEAEGSRVIVTWVPPAGSVDLRQRGIDETQAADLRRRLAPFAEDWDRPEMAAYDELPPR